MGFITVLIGLKGKTLFLLTLTKHLFSKYSYSLFEWIGFTLTSFYNMIKEVLFFTFVHPFLVIGKALVSTANFLLNAGARFTDKIRSFFFQLWRFSLNISSSGINNSWNFLNHLVKSIFDFDDPANSPSARPDTEARPEPSRNESTPTQTMDTEEYAYQDGHDLFEQEIETALASEESSPLIPTADTFPDIYETPNITETSEIPKDVEISQLLNQQETLITNDSKATVNNTSLEDLFPEKNQTSESFSGLIDLERERLLLKRKPSLEFKPNDC